MDGGMSVVLQGLGSLGNKKVRDSQEEHKGCPSGRSTSQGILTRRRSLVTKETKIPKEIPGQSGRGNIVGTSGILPEVGCEAAPSHVHLGIQGGSKRNLFSCKRCGQPVSVGFPCNARGLCLIRMPRKLRKDRLWNLFVLPDGVHFWWCPCSVQDVSFRFFSLQHCTCNEARMFRLRRLFPRLCLFRVFLRGCLQVFQLPNVRRFTSHVPCMCW